MPRPFQVLIFRKYSTASKKVNNNNNNIGLFKIEIWGIIHKIDYLLTHDFQDSVSGAPYSIGGSESLLCVSL